jgi:lauroyl/myristoyl acyltransferase
MVMIIMGVTTTTTTMAIPTTRRLLSKRLNLIRSQVMGQVIHMHQPQLQLIIKAMIRDIRRQHTAMAMQHQREDMAILT